VGHAMIVSVQGQKAGLGNEEKQQERDGVANERWIVCQYSPKKG
jgi:hypothetical protein